MRKALRFLAAILGSACYLFGSGGVLVHLFTGISTDLNVLLLSALYPVDIWCFWLVSGSNRWKVVIPIAAFFPFYLMGIFIIFAVICDWLLPLGVKDAPFLAAIPAIVAGCVSVRYVKHRYFSSHA